ncbi:MAG: hypothetical protein P0S96_02510 [Simkaniaceae bacterium]|nr:hypothetical protein [Candidatus Sacchlamyda saccharinae]
MFGRDIKITPLISLSGSMYLCTHTEEGEYKYPNLGGRILTKAWDFCTVIVGLIEGIVRGTIGLIGLIFLTILDVEQDKNSLSQKIVGDILCTGAGASFTAFNYSLVSIFLGDC